MKLIRVANIELAAYLIISAEEISVKISDDHSIQMVCIFFQKEFSLSQIQLLLQFAQVSENH
jgi:hypothetical protein